MYSTVYQFLRKYLLPGHREIRRCLQELESSQWLPRDRLEELQLQKIQRLVSYAYEHVPFYRRYYKSEGILPQDIKSLKDFEALPFLTRDDVNKHGEELVATSYKGEFSAGQTSGSTGEPMRFIMDRSAAYWSYAFEARCRGWYGVKRGEKMAWVTVRYAQWPWRERLASKIKRYRYLDTRTITKSKMQVFAEMLVRWRPAMMMAYPSALSMFAQYLKENDITGITPKLIETIGEKVTLSQRRLLEEVFQAPVADHYGSQEIHGYAYECPEGSRHVSEERYLELVEKGQIVNPGQMGEVVVTALNQYAMPFIRYKNGDLGIYESDNCGCGRGMPVLCEIVGRKSDWLVRPDGNIVNWATITDIMKYKQEVYQYQIYQPDREHLEVRLLCIQEVDSAFLENIRSELQPFLGESTRISVKVVDHIEPSSNSGKHQFIISEVKPDSL